MAITHAPGITVLRYPTGAVVVVAGLPGAGKTTLLRRLLLTPAPRVLDPQTGYDRYGRLAASRLGHRLLRLLIHAEHRVRVALALLGGGSLVVHETTRPGVLRWIARLARLRGRPAHLLVLDVDHDTAVRGQHERGRRVSPVAMRSHTRRFQALREDGDGVDEFASCRTLSRSEANALTHLRFDLASAAVPEWEDVKPPEPPRSLDKLRALRRPAARARSPVGRE